MKIKTKQYIKDCIICVIIFSFATFISFVLKRFDSSDTYVPTLFVVAVLLTSRYTNGYVYGIISSIIGVFLVNFIFTYPYFKFDFSISGYPLTFICMFCASIVTSTMTTRIKRQEEIKIEIEKEKMRGNLLRAISHDLRTPLTSIMGTTSALLENDNKITDDQRNELIKESHDDAEWLIRMVENLLSITRINGEAKITKSPEAVEEIIGETIVKFSKRFSDIHLKVSVPDELLIVPMDAMLIEQVIINLLENAVIHSKETSGIELLVKKDNDFAIFIVRDCGKGIKESEIKHLFDGYLSSSEEKDADNKRNMGIGLSVCMTIIKAHGGNMNARNRKSGGAEFSFSLPLQ